MTPTVEVKGLKETIRAFNRLDKRVAKEIKDELKKVAEPVVSEIQHRLSRYRGVSMNVRPHALTKGVVIRQNARKVSGLRGDFGGIQMTTAFIPAAYEKEDEIVRGLEHALDVLTREEGF